MIEEKCGNCRFSNEPYEDDDGEMVTLCRRYPPRVSTEMSGVDPRAFAYIDRTSAFSHPIVFCDNWCGEWRGVTITKASKLNDVSVDDAGLSTRTTNALKAEGIFDFQVAAGMSEKDLLKIQNIGHLSVREIRQAAEIMKSKP